MSTTSAVILNVFLFAAIIVALLWLLAHAGVAKSRRHEIKMLRLHSRRR
ncbi:MAG TPA: hypothetical protein VGU02_16025 [Gaiellaceae bacterium]|nr:hypothetical protein [Gaiellaceae bacterium]